MGAIDVLFQQQQAKKQDWQNVGQGLSGLGESAKNIAGTTKIQKYKKAGQMLFKLGGPTERNLQMVVKMFDLAPEEAKELIVTYQTFETFKNNRRLDEPVSPATAQAFAAGRGIQPEEGATYRDLLKLSKILPEKKGKEWGSQLTVPVGEEGGGKFISNKPGTEIPPDFTVPSLAGKGSESTKKAKTEKLKAVRGSLEKALSSYNNIMSNVGIYVPDENKRELAEQRKAEVIVHAQNYIANGGNVEDLGYENIEILKDLFTGEPEEVPDLEEPDRKSVV